MTTRRHFLLAGLAGIVATSRLRAQTEPEANAIEDAKASPYSDGHIYSMPAHFGGAPGGMRSVTYWDTDTAAVFYETDGEALSRLLPSGFKLLRAELMVAAMMNRGVTWMAGEPYNILAVNAPVQFKGKREVVEGWFSLVVWENNATPIISGRENTGIPKIPANIEDFRFQKDQMRTWTHKSGHTFFEMHLDQIKTASAMQAHDIKGKFSHMNWMGWRYIPKINTLGEAELSQPTLYPQEFSSEHISVSEGNVQWSVPAQWKNPTQHHIISQIAALPVVKMSGPAVIIKNAKSVLRTDLARVLE